MADPEKIAVASLNPVKTGSALQGFQEMFPGHRFEVQGFAVESGVSDQPMSCAETLRGATNRAEILRTQNTDAEFVVGIEGGIESIDGTMFASAWIVIMDRDDRVGRGRSGSFALPGEVQRLVESGMELGLANDKVFDEHNSKHAGGAVGSLTGGVISRQKLYEHAMALALVTFKQPDLYGAGFQPEVPL